MVPGACADPECRYGHLQMRISTLHCDKVQAMNNSQSTLDLSSASASSPSRQSRETLRDGTPVLVRPIEAGDVGLERDFIERLSPKSRRYRFLGYHLRRQARRY